MPAELRCPSKLHALLKGECFEVKCSSRFCGAGTGIVVLHLFSIHTGELIRTNKYNNARKEGKWPVH